jgi:hypothetical protein
MLLLLALQLVSADTLRIRATEQPPLADFAPDTTALGSPQVRIQTGQGMALVWLLRVRDTVYVAARIPDSTPYWGDDFVLSLDTAGDAAAVPQHDDFQLYFRRVLDSSVVFRGRAGRWEPPRDDPDWRLGKERSGGGWEVSGRNGQDGWSLLLRLDPAWLAGEAGRPVRVAFRIYDDAPGGWYSWPPPAGRLPANSVEGRPEVWIPVK